MELTETKLLAFDADDTLWDCQSFFDDISRRYCEFLAHYGNIDAIGEALFKVEMGNMEELGYGTKAFVISLVENALRISDYRLDAHETEEIVRLGRSLLRLPATPFPGVTETLQKLKAQDGYTMVVLTKGDYLEQERKFHRSGLKEFFDDFIVVSEKTSEVYQRMCRQFGVQPSETIMIGNSFKSDIHPALQAGCHAIYIPHHTTWQYEHAEPIEHERLVTINKFDELWELLGS